MSIRLDRAKKLLNCKFSILVAKANKQPLHSWKEFQTSQITVKQLEQEVQKFDATYLGYATGYEDVFCIDVDLKVLHQEDRKDWFDEFIGHVRSQIDGFDKKVSVHKTMNFGYHLTYRTKTEMGNEKLAVPSKSGMNRHEAVIETRGQGGYAIVYDDCYNELDYTEIQYLTKEEHDLIIEVCRMYDERPNIEEDEIEPVVVTQKSVRQSGNFLYASQDYNDNHQVLDVVGDEFKVIRQTSKFTVIKRHGATSAHSGYIYKDTEKLYLFSTGTQYPSLQPLSPFDLYNIKYHNGDKESAYWDLYHKGYGDRVKKEPPKNLVERTLEPESDNEFPLDVFPKTLQNYLIECNQKLDSSTDYMGCGVLWAMSVIIGNSMKVEVKRGWIEPVTLWIAVVGKKGWGKSHPLSNAIGPLQRESGRNEKDYKRQYKKWQEYCDLSEQEKKMAEEVRKPVKKQFITNDITMERLVQLHEENPNGVGVYRDEIAGWIKDMNKYRAGSDVETWLSIFSNKSISVNRKTAGDNYVESPIVPVIGSIQPVILSAVMSPEHQESGFSDRLLVSYPNLEIDYFNQNELDEDMIEWYDSWMLNLFALFRNDMLEVDDDGYVIPKMIRFDDEAYAEWTRIFNKITDIQNSDDETEFIKGLLPKQKLYIPRFALILNVLEAYENGEMPDCPITKDSILKAEKLSDYFTYMARKIKIDSIEHSKMKGIINEKRNDTEYEKFVKLYTANPKLNKTNVAEELNISRATIYRWVKELENEQTKP